MGLSSHITGKISNHQVSETKILQDGINNLPFTFCDTDNFPESIQVHSISGPTLSMCNSIWQIKGKRDNIYQFIFIDETRISSFVFLSWQCLNLSARFFNGVFLPIFVSVGLPKYIQCGLVLQTRLDQLYNRFWGHSALIHLYQDIEVGSYQIIH